MYQKRPDIRIVALAVVVAVIVSVFFLVVRPAATGYVVYKEIKESNQSVDEYMKGIQELRSLLQKSDNDLSRCSDANKDFLDKLDEFSAKITVCEKERGSLEAQVNLLKDSSDQKIKLLESMIADLEKELSDMKKDQKSFTVQQQKDYDVLAQNLANSICCKERVDNPDISHFRVENHKIVCLEDGSLKIECP